MAHDTHHAASVIALQQLKEQRLLLHLPVLLVPEVSAALARNTRDAARGIQAIEMLRITPFVQWYPLTEVLAHAAADLASTQFLRGADAVYAGIAAATGSTLLTWDRELRARSHPLVKAVTPTEWLALPTT